jgi:hypothetical protein
MYKHAFGRLSTGLSDRDCHTAQRALENVRRAADMAPGMNRGVVGLCLSELGVRQERFLAASLGEPGALSAGPAALSGGCCSLGRLIGHGPVGEIMA